MNALCREVLRRLDAGMPSVLVTIMDHQGSAPRTAGARMLVAPDGAIAGTVGGGRYEAEAIAVALDLHAAGRLRAPDEPAPAAFLHYSLRGVTDLDMICGGALTLLLEYIADTPSARTVFSAGKEAEDAREPFVLLTRYSVHNDAVPGGAAGQAASAGRRAARAERFIWLPEKRIILPGDGDALEAVRAFPARPGGLGGDEPRHMEHGGAHYLLEPFPRPFRVIFFGGGHVSRETAALALNVGFQNIVVEDRPEYAAPERFPGSATELLPSLGEEDCARLLGALEPGPCDGIVIVTRGHSHDRDALAAALRTGAGYIGMIGSRSKREAVYRALRQIGMAEDSLAAVRSPIGLAIGAETPAEIAVSIVAELIAWRKGARGAGGAFC